VLVKINRRLAAIVAGPAIGSTATTAAHSLNQLDELENSVLTHYARNRSATPLPQTSGVAGAAPRTRV